MTERTDAGLCGWQGELVDGWLDRCVLPSGHAGLHRNGRTDAGRLDRRGMRARAERATPGPWARYVDSVFNGRKAEPIGSVVEAPGRTNGRVNRVCSVTDWQGGTRQKDDANFIAHARSDIPALLDLTDTLVERLRGSIALLDEFDRYASVPDDTGYATSPFRARIAEAILDDLALLASLGEGEG